MMYARVFVVTVLIQWLSVQQIGSCPSNICSCSGDILECSMRNLTSIPYFIEDYTVTEIRLDHNLLNTVANGSFQNLKILSRIFLNDNNISTVESNAFLVVDRTVNEVDLADNILEEFPKAIGMLQGIRRINVVNNPIPDNKFDEHTMYSIGDTLERFEFGSNVLEAWPITLRHLQALEYLNVSGGSFYTLPPDAFRGFEGTLKLLSIQYTKLIALPLALARLRFLESLYFDHNHDIGDSGVLIPSFGNDRLLERLRLISLVDDNLTVFPSLLRYFHGVEKLILDSNILAFVSDTSVQVAVGTNISDLSLRNCSLSRVPGAISKLTNLTVLNLAENNIHSFENNDFANMSQLQNLTITRNPIGYIADEAFKDLKSLRYLDMEESEVQRMPEAIRYLSQLLVLKLPLAKIECTCNIAWLKQFMDVCNRGLHIDGSCETINSKVEDYLKNFVDRCPNYHNSTVCV